MSKGNKKVHFLEDIKDEEIHKKIRTDKAQKFLENQLNILKENKNINEFVENFKQVSGLLEFWGLNEIQTRKINGDNNDINENKHKFQEIYDNGILKSSNRMFFDNEGEQQEEANKQNDDDMNFMNEKEEEEDEQQQEEEGKQKLGHYTMTYSNLLKNSFWNLARIFNSELNVGKDWINKYFRDNLINGKYPLSYYFIHSNEMKSDKELIEMIDNYSYHESSDGKRKDHWYTAIKICNDDWEKNIYANPFLVLNTNVHQFKLIAMLGWPERIWELRQRILPILIYIKTAKMNDNLFSVVLKNMWTWLDKIFFCSKIQLLFYLMRVITPLSDRLFNLLQK
jgi:hypothetical protein